MVSAKGFRGRECTEVPRDGEWGGRHWTHSTQASDGSAESATSQGRTRKKGRGGGRDPWRPGHSLRSPTDGSQPCSFPPALGIGKGIGAKAPARGRRSGAVTGQTDGCTGTIRMRRRLHINHTSCFDKRERSECFERSQEWPCALSERVPRHPPGTTNPTSCLSAEASSTPSTTKRDSGEEADVPPPRMPPTALRPDHGPVGRTRMSTELPSQCSSENREEQAVWLLEMPPTPPRGAPRRRERHPRSVPGATARPGREPICRPRGGPGFA